MINSKFSLYFGDKSTAIDPKAILLQSAHFFDYPTVFQHQVHGTQGYCITSNNRSSLSKCLSYDSDYLITQQKNLQIGVLTADCLPIALYDPINKAIGIIHAGWRGTTQEIVLKAIEHMQRSFKTHIQNLQFFFGPSAKPCCYEVPETFIEQLPNKSIATLVSTKKGAHYTFDLPRYNIELLHSIGINNNYIDLSKNACTICNEKYCSYRRDKESVTRQISVIRLY